MCSEWCGGLFAGRVARTNHLPKVARSFIRRPTDATDLSVIMSSHMCVYKTNTESLRALSMDWFIESALRYRLTGEPARSLCEHNAGIATALSRSQVAQTWRLLQLMCTASSSSATMSCSTASHTQPASVSNTAALQLTEPGYSYTQSQQWRF